MDEKEDVRRTNGNGTVTWIKRKLTVTPVNADGETVRERDEGDRIRVWPGGQDLDPELWAWGMGDASRGD